ncbi:MAG TPA: SxtJ family membrane protein [Polyangia bacterium]|jgi:MFS family permease|nr:SxtJ family membrane protein [Polyangia bacterium]
MDLYKDINRNPSRRSLLSFGLVVMAGFAAMAALANFKSHKPDLALVLAVVGVAVLFLSFVPGLGRLLYVGWMGLGLTIGFVTSPIIMGVIYLLVIVPVALVFKIGQRDLMRRKLDRTVGSYWEDYPRTDDPGTYVRQY